MAPHTDGVLQCRPDEGCRRVHDRRSLGRLGLVAKVDRRFVPKEPSELRVCRSDEGGDEGNRTPNPRLAKAVLCQPRRGHKGRSEACFYLSLIAEQPGMPSLCPNFGSSRPTRRHGIGVVQSPHRRRDQRLRPSAACGLDSPGAPRNAARTRRRCRTPRRSPSVGGPAAEPEPPRCRLQPRGVRS